MKVTWKTAAWALLVAFAFSGMAISGEKPRVAFSQMETDNSWRITETDSIRNEAKARGIELIYTDAQGSTAKQISDMEDIIAQQPDFILLAPREFEGLSSSLQSAKEAEIPVILLDRDAAGVPGEDYVTLIAADFIWEGKTCAEIAYKHFGDKPCNIVEVMGTPGSSVARDRSKGFRDEIAKHPNMKIVSSQVGNFNRSTAQKTVENVLQAMGDDVDLIYGHSDEDGIGALQAVKASGRKPGKEIFIIGINGQLDALKAIAAGEYLATVECSPQFGVKAFDTVEKLWRGEKVPTFIQNPGKIYDISNAEALMHEGY